MNTNMNRLSESQDQLLTNIQHLQAAQQNDMNEYGIADRDVKPRIMSRMKDNQALQTKLLGSVATVRDVVANAESDTAYIARLVAGIAELQKLKLAQLEALQESHDGKKRMIELNTYYGKRFMAQSGVMKIFIYMCIPVLILAILANAGLFPSYIAGFMIVAIVVVGVVYIYAAVHDINRRDNRNFDEYTWEFDPSRVGHIVNATYDDASGKATIGSGAVGCFNGNCCNPPDTVWDDTMGRCKQDPAGGSTTKTANSEKSLKSRPAAFVGNLNS